jgi:multidrug efflux pump
VVENVERNIEGGLRPREATIKAMTEVTSPIIAITLVLCAVFVPIAFISGLTGQFYRQFALTIAFSTIISAFNSLTLSPALAAVLLKSHHDPKDWPTRGVDLVFGRFFAQFNRFFQRSSKHYGTGVNGILGRKALAICIYVLLLGTAYVGFQKVPPGFVPVQDKQYLVSFAQLPDVRRSTAPSRSSAICPTSPSRIPASKARSHFPASRSTASSIHRVPASSS